MRLLPALLFAIICCNACTGCSRKEASPPAKTARISATNAFVSYFGPPPTTNKGTCYAFVIYFPSATEPGKVTPFPFFTFDAGSMKKVAIERLIGGMEEKSLSGQFLQFPKGARLISLTEQAGEVVANFSNEVAQAASDETMATALNNAVSLTLMQFAGVTDVHVQGEGKDLFPPTAAPPDQSAVSPPAAPRLLNVIAAKERGAASVTEVDALFDRPVDIKQCQFSTSDGAALQGEVFHTMFDMAAVLKPKDPSKLTPGTKVRVRWQVTDGMGRSASGDNVFPLEVKVHQD